MKICTLLNEIFQSYCKIPPKLIYNLLNSVFQIIIHFLPRDALQCKARYCDRMSSVCPFVCLSVCL